MRDCGNSGKCFTVIPCEFHQLQYDLSIARVELNYEHEMRVALFKKKVHLDAQVKGLSQLVRDCGATISELRREIEFLHLKIGGYTSLVDSPIGGYTPHASGKPLDPPKGE